MKNFLNFKMNPYRDWRIILGIFLVGLIIISFLAWKVYLSSQIADGYFSEYISENTTNVKDVNLKKLQISLSVLKSRGDGLIKVIDPSL